VSERDAADPVPAPGSSAGSSADEPGVPEGLSGRGVGRRLGARRRGNVVGGRQHRHTVKVSPEEEARLRLMAGEQQVTVARLLAESALAGSGVNAAEHRQLAAELFAAKRLLASIANNVNQLAKVANSTGEVPPEMAATLDAVRRVAARIEASVQGLGEVTGRVSRRAGQR
jgi:hypothetical protein